MNLLKTAGKTLAITAAVLMLAVPAMAGNGKGAGVGQGTGDRTRSRVKDGACQRAVEQNQDLLQLAGNGKRNGGTGNNQGVGPGDGTGTGDGMCDCPLDGLCDNA